MSKLRAYLVLMRPPNLLTALADILAGFAASASLQHVRGPGVFNFIQHQLPWEKLCLTGLSSVCLYAGGVVLNDVFDAKLDQVERPERPIPSGLVPRTNAAIMGGLFLIMGVIMAFLSNRTSGLMALIISALVLSYDAVSKSHPIAGPLNMGLCRGMNLLLGVCIFPGHLTELGFLAIIPIIYVVAITVTSRGEVHGGDRMSFNLSMGLFLLTALMLISLGVLEQFSLWQCLIYVTLLMAMVIPPLLRARRSNDPAMIGKAVKSAVLGLIILDAAIAAGFTGWFFGLLLLILLPFSVMLAKVFAVT